MSAAGDDFETWSTALYGAPGVAETCLGWQDRHGANVNLALFCCWVGATGRGRLGPGDFARLAAAVAAWHAMAVAPLRALRRALRAPPAGADAAAAEALRARVKSIEIDAERIEQAALAAALARSAAAAGHERGARDAAHNLAGYLRFVGAPEDPAAVALLVAAAAGREAG